jgi:NADPH:quinone reductase-like Zn-dependent oxidoreductase
VRAAIRERYGSPARVVEIREVDRPTPDDDEVLVRVHTASVNIADWYDVVGRPRIARFSTGLRAPKEARLGVDYAGVVEEVGKDVTDFAPGDEVFGARTGAYADYVVAKADRAIVRKPANTSFEVAAATPVAAVTALQALRDHGGLQPGQAVLVHGASGGVGTYTVQVAKALGAGSVTAVCSTPNVEIAESLGADRVVDYTRTDCTEDTERYDLLIDIAGTRPLRRLRRVLKPGSTAVVVGGPRQNRLLGPLGHVVGAKLTSIATRQKMAFFIAKLTKEDMETLRELLETGQLTSVIDSTFPLEEVAAALEHQGSGHPRGKIVVTIRRSANAAT